jgi:hypothetical protein
MKTDAKHTASLTLNLKAEIFTQEMLIKLTPSLAPYLAENSV